MRQFFLSLLLSFLVTPLLADTLTVKVDGSGDYPYIQNAVGWSSNGDVILVYPGTYYENIDLFGRDSLTIASLYLINPVDSNLHNTIINGSHNGSCFAAFRGEQNLRFVGLTVTNAAPIVTIYSHFQNGSGFNLFEVSALIENCIIYGNFASSGGGICSHDSYIYLSKTKIFNNHAYTMGGGILAGSGDIQYDSINLCDLYLNTAARGTDLCQGDTSNFYPIILDTATVLNPDHYYFLCMDSNDNPISCSQIIINHAKIQDVSADVYVNPYGSDANSGLSPDNPLKTLSFALLKVKSDSLHRNTIHLANGIYSPSNGNKFPIGIKSFVPIVGENIENTVIDLDSSLIFSSGNSGEKEIILKNFTVKNGVGDSAWVPNYMMMIRNCEFVLLDGLNFQNCSSKESWSQVLELIGCDSLYLKNSSFKENHIANIIHIGDDYGHEKPLYTEITSCRITKNFPNITPDEYNINVGLSLYDGGNSNLSTVKLINCEFTGNKTDNNNFRSDDSRATEGINIHDNVLAYIWNSTIADHITPYEDDAGLYLNPGAKVYLHNSIVSGNDPYQITLYSGYGNEDTTRLHVCTSLIQDGADGILNVNPEFCFVYYYSTNLDADPVWVNSGDFPYSLLAGSPCINAGTQALPEGISLPDHDLAGNPRISGGEIDMGAYEFLFVGLNEDITKGTKGLICASPNPFKDQLNITLSNSLLGKQAELKLYDLTGNPVATIFNGRINVTTISWTPGKDQSQIRPGVYLLKCKAESSIIETIKVIKI